MTLRRFIDVSFAILVEMFQQHMTLPEAINKVRAWAGETVEETTDAEKIDNASSMNQLASIMAGVKGAPV